MRPHTGRVRTAYVRNGEIPADADLLRTRAGSTYLVVGVHGRRLELVGVPANAETTGDTWEWEWAKRKRRNA